jgi:hypothetical protein
VPEKTRLVANQVLLRARSRVAVKVGPQVHMLVKLKLIKWEGMDGLSEGLLLCSRYC